MTIIYMLETRHGSPNGLWVNEYEEGKHYEVPHSLACVFLNSGWAIEIPEEDRQRLPLPNVHMSGFNANAAARLADLSGDVL